MKIWTTKPTHTLATSACNVEAISVGGIFAFGLHSAASLLERPILTRQSVLAHWCWPRTTNPLPRFGGAFSSSQLKSKRGRSPRAVIQILPSSCEARRIVRRSPAIVFGPMVIGPACSPRKRDAASRCARSFQRSASPSHFQLCWISNVARWRHNNSISRQPTGSFMGTSLDQVARTLRPRTRRSH